MPRIAWATDVHLNFVSRARFQPFLDEAAACQGGAMVLTGDIAEAPSFRQFLLAIAEKLEKPVYFVLGNHDSYYGGIERARDTARLACRQSPWLHWLSEEAAPVELSPETALTGHCGWADARLGDFRNSKVWLADFELIRDFEGLRRDAIRAKLERLGDEAATHLARLLDLALPRYRNLLVATHIPPWREAAWHRGQPSDDHWLPFFSCGAAGDAIRAAFERHPDRRGTVLCGHTHGDGVSDILPNLRAITGGAEYGDPRMQTVLDVP